MTRVKICGLMSRQDLEYALSAGADAVGFVVEIDSSRHCLSAAAAADLIRRVPIYSKSVAVINPRDVDDALRLAHETGADVLQVHGSLSPGDLAELKGRAHQKIIAAVAAEPGEKMPGAMLRWQMPSFWTAWLVVLWAVRERFTTGWSVWR